MFIGTCSFVLSHVGICPNVFTMFWTSGIYHADAKEQSINKVLNTNFVPFLAMDDESKTLDIMDFN